ncbi:unnamed protein product [Ophioblennius macclurei]
MTEVTEEVMDSPVLSQEEAEEKKQPSKGGDAQKSQSGAAADVIPGKRVKKTVERFDFQAPKQREQVRVGDGCGEKLGEIPRTNYQITKMKPADLKALHTVLFDRPGKMASIKKQLRLFNGFSFDSDSEQFTKKRDKMLKSSNITNSKLKVMCTVLDLEKKGTHSDLVDRILTFLTSPKSSGKPLLTKKKKKSKKKLSGDDTSPQAKKKKKNSKPKASSSSSSPKKSKAGNKSKAIVMDSSSDDDEDEEEEEEEKPRASAKEKPSEREENSSEEESEEEEEEEEEASKPKPARTSNASKKQTAKRPRTSGKKSSAPRKRAKKSSDQSSSQSKSESESSSESRSESESDGKHQAQKKKPLAKTKKADSSSNRKNTHAAEDSSDEDEPLIKMIKKAPSDDQLKETLQKLLKDADLKEMTMKQICQRVFDLYPEHDLSSRKDFIKQTVRDLLT